jgi:signal transduction histidine kinase
MSPTLPLVLNVDDYESARYVRSRALRAAGFEVIEAGTGREALEAAHARQPSAILLDVNLPDMNGFEVCRRLKDDAATMSIPILYLSASATSPADRATGLDIGADAYLIDPVDVPVLVATVNAVMRAQRAQTQATAARDEAEAANRAKDEVLAMLSHEMRGPLNTIVGWVSMLRSGRVDAERTRTALETIDRAARQQTRLVDDLLDIARIGAGTLRLELRPMDLRAVVEATIAALAPEIEEAGVLLERRIGDVGQIVGDDRRLQQVVWNLVANAIKFTPRGGQITVSLDRVDGSARLTVTDTGQGIAPDFLPHVFDRYRQAEDSAAARRRGLGLGLAIVQHVVHLHGGDVNVTSDGLGKGSTFTVMLATEPRAAR